MNQPHIQNLSTFVIFFNDAPVFPHGINSGGGEGATLNLALEIKRKGYKVICCANLPEGETVKEGMEFWNLGSGYDVFKLLDRLKQLPPFIAISSTIVHPFLIISHLENCQARIIINHSGSETSSGLEMSTVCENVDRVICVSDAQRARLTARLKNNGQFMTIRNGFDPTLFTYHDSAGRDPYHLIFVGRIEIWKGAHHVLAMFPSLKRKYPQLKVTMIGDYSHWPEIRDSKAEIESINPGLKLLGLQPQSQIQQLMHQCGALLFPSISFETAGLAVVDAQVSGCPVVAFDVGGVSEYLDTNCGILLKEHTAEALCANLDSLLSNPATLLSMSEQCRHYSKAAPWSYVAMQVIDACSKVITEKN